ncbi:MAG: ROK family protein [Clostridia bacterium]|nr:ROK family protein [Clostridia bacterium]
MYLGIDIGGTSVKWGVVDEELNVLENSYFPTVKDSDYVLMDKISELINEKKEKYDITGVGMGFPGFVDNINGIVYGADNIPFKSSRVRDYIEGKTGVSVSLDNDANCATLAEYSLNKKGKNMILLTLGTGVGGGIVIDGRLYRGKGGAGEIGHMTLIHKGRKCPCGRQGCFEQYASASALTRMAREVVEQKGGLIEGEKLDLSDINGKVIFDCFRRGSADAAEIIDKYASYLADGIESLICIFDPDEIVLAGGITNEKDALLGALYRHLPENCPVRIAELTSDAGFIGAALLCK